MVFATDFDYYKEPNNEKEQNSELERAGSLSASSLSSHSLSVHHSSANISANRNPQAVRDLTLIRDLTSQGLAKSGSVESHAVESNVVPLHVGAPAARVRLENKSLLLPRQPKLSLGLQLLNRMQQVSALVMGVLVTGALAVYGSTVYVDKSTSRALVQLDELQGESQQLTSANESIKQSLAEQAVQENSGLEPYEAGDVILLTPAPRREGAAPEEPAPELPGPLGY